MGQVYLLKIAADGIPLEMAAADEITLTSYTVTGVNGPVLSISGLDLNTQNITDSGNLSFATPASAVINLTAGNLIVDNIMRNEGSNTMTIASDVLFPAITDVAGQVDIFRLPALAGAPTAAPTKAGEGYIVWDSTNDNLYIWNGSSWDNLSTVTSAVNVDDTLLADAAITIRDVVYISSAGHVSSAQANTAVKSQALGLAVNAAALAEDPVAVRKLGKLGGFSLLTPGGRYYLSGAAAGVLVSSPPTGTGHTVVQIGYARSASELDIQIQSLGRRA